MKLSASVDSYLFDGNLPTTTRRWYKQKLDAWLDWMRSAGLSDTSEVTWATVLGFQQHLLTLSSEQYKRPLSSHTVHGYLRSLRAYCRWAVAEELVDAKVLTKWKMPKQEASVITPFTRDHINRMLRAAREQEDTSLAERDEAIIYLLLDTGIRASELLGLTLENTHLDHEDAHIRVLGKGSKWREVGLGRTSRKALHRYIHRFRPNSTAPQVFLSRRGESLTVEGIDHMLYRLRERGDITGVRCSCHTFRHTYALQYISSGGDVVRLSRLLGHTSLAVTMEYLKQFQSWDARNGKSIVDEMF